MSKRSEKLDDLLYKGREESIFKKIRNAIEKNPHVIADKSCICLVLYDRCDPFILLQKVMISSGGK